MSLGCKPKTRQQFSADKTRICSSRTVAGQFQFKSGMPPFGWKPRAKNSCFSAGRVILRSSRTVAGQCQIRSGMHPFGWKPLQPSLERSACRNVTFNTTHRDSEQHRVSKTSSRPSSSVQRKRDIAAAERWRGSFNPNRACTRSVGSPGPDSSSVQAKRDFAATEEQ